MTAGPALTPVRLKYVRRRLGLSQMKMGQLLNVHQTLVSHWEQGSRTPDAQQRAFYGFLLRASETATEAQFQTFHGLLAEHRFTQALVMMAAVGLPEPNPPVDHPPHNINRQETGEPL